MKFLKKLYKKIHSLPLAKYPNINLSDLPIIQLCEIRATVVRLLSMGQPTRQQLQDNESRTRELIQKVRFALQETDSIDVFNIGKVTSNSQRQKYSAN